ncbi:MAG: amylo-alpha-1,6-glucosidase [Deltaproteobacteria bacterium]|nr:amylo-alpha-1,6-glucosidase [Deltaproteobacteria bacterium]
MPARIPHPIEVLHGGGVGLACALDGHLDAEQLHGLFAGDTRVLSTYRLSLAGHPFQVLSRVRRGPSEAEWHMQNATVQHPAGVVPEGTVYLRVLRRVDGGLRDELTLGSYLRTRAPLRFVLRLDADFADLFEVKSGTISPRLSVLRLPQPDGIDFLYERRGFRRGLQIRIDATSGPPERVASLLVFDLDLSAHAEWRCRIDASPVVDGRVLRVAERATEPERAPDGPIVREAGPLAPAFRAGQRDLARLEIPQPDAPPFVAAGAPWFLALFGRDTLVTALMTSLLGQPRTIGALTALARLQATDRDDFRDAEPGKIPHELRIGELARSGRIPHTPYYGTHDAPALFVLALWNAWRWTGDRALLDRFLAPARAALTWCDGPADLDGDGLIEYRTRSPLGYRNQAWMDAGDAIVRADGRPADAPIATIELQAYLFAARLAMAELLAAAGDQGEAARLRASARALREVVEERFWMEDEGTYAVALDGAKARVASIGSNPGHVLWCGLARPERARRVAARLLRDDMFSGFGVRTLSSKNPAYNPLSYQLGSVWPHDTALAAAGLSRYGLRDEAATLIEAVLSAAAGFEDDRLPELWCGFPREGGSPVPYERANSPQAWAAAAPILAAQLFLGLCPDAPRGRAQVAPWLPSWLPALAIDRVPIGTGTVDFRLSRARDGRVALERSGDGGLAWIEGVEPAPLWGAPPGW